MVWIRYLHPPKNPQPLPSVLKWNMHMHTYKVFLILSLCTCALGCKSLGFTRDWRETVPPQCQHHFNKCSYKIVFARRTGICQVKDIQIWLKILAKVFKIGKIKLILPQNWRLILYIWDVSRYTPLEVCIRFLYWICMSAGDCMYL